MTKKAQVHLLVPADNKNRWVHASREAGMRLSDWITEAVDAYMDENGARNSISAGRQHGDMGQVHEIPKDTPKDSKAPFINLNTVAFIPKAGEIAEHSRKVNRVKIIISSLLAVMIVGLGVLDVASAAENHDIGFVLCVLMGVFAVGLMASCSEDSEAASPDKISRNSAFIGKHEHIRENFSMLYREQKGVILNSQLDQILAASNLASRAERIEALMADRA